MKHDWTHACSAVRQHEYGTAGREYDLQRSARVRIEVRCEGDEGRWYLVVRNDELGIYTRVQIHTCPWCSARLLMTGETPNDRGGEPGSFVNASKGRACEANPACQRPMGCWVTVEGEQRIQQIPCCHGCASYLGGFWRGMGRNVKIVYATGDN